MGTRNLEDAWRQAMARRSTAKTAMATACLPYLVDSSFRARPVQTAVAAQSDADRQRDSG